MAMRTTRLAARNDPSRPQPEEQNRENQHREVSVGGIGDRRDYAVEAADYGCARQETRHTAESADDEDKESAKHIVEPHEGLHRHQRRNHDTAEAGKAGTHDKGAGRKPPHRNSLRLRKLRIAYHRADTAAGAAAPVPDDERGYDHERDRYQQQPIDRIFGTEKLDGTRKWNVEAAKSEAEHRLRHLSQQQAKSPGRYQRVERAPVERSDHDPFDRGAKKSAHNERQRQSRQIGPAPGLRDVGAIGADHDELAVRDVEHTEQPEDHGKAKHQNGKSADGVDDVDRLGDDQRIHP